jgi:membrane associated rhomboid family serine protease
MAYRCAPPFAGIAGPALTEATPPSTSSPPVREPIVRAPAVVLVSIGVLAAIHIVTLFLSPDTYDAVIETFGFVPARVQDLLGSPSLDHLFWGLTPFLTYALLHGGFMHLGVNCLAFLIFGTVVARRIGPVQFLSFSIVTAIAAILTHLFAHWGDSTAVIGASGAISGYMGGATRFIFLDPRNPAHAHDHRLPLLSRPVIMFALVFTLLNAGVGLTGFSPDGSQDLTAWEAHIGGFFAGLVLFPLFDRRRYWLS